MVRRSLPLLSAMLAAVFGAPAAQGAMLDGTAIPSSGLTLRATQDTPTGFGDAAGSTQASSGSELNELYADIDGGVLKIGITGNLQDNFNKFFVFIDAVDGGESSLAGDNSDGGFNEINNMAGLSFAGGVTMDHGLRFEVGGGFVGANFFDLIDNTAFNVASGGGPGDLPFDNVSSGGVTVGWDNTNGVGVTDVDASGADTATTGWEIEIDMLQAFGSVRGDVNIAMIITSGDAGFLSNQSLPGLNGAGNLGGGSGQTLPVAAVPEPTTVALCGLVGVAFAARRR